MTDSMVERVARTICAAMGDEPDRLWVGYHPPIDLNDPEFEEKAKASEPAPMWQAKYLTAALGAIEAMREPTTEMWSAGDLKIDNGGIWGTNCTAVWQAMLDSAGAVCARCLETRCHCKQYDAVARRREANR